MALSNPNNNAEIVYSGDTVKSALTNYSLRYTLRPLNTLWALFKEMFWSSYFKNIDILNGDLVANYDYTTTTITTTDNGDITHTHTPDDARNYIESSVNSDVSKTVSAGTGNSTPKTDTYSVVYDDTPKHTSYTTQSGETTERTTADEANNKNKTIDNLKYTDTESHSTITKTVDGNSITADDIKTEKTTKTGIQNIDKTDIVKNAIELNKISVLNSYIEHFIDKYSFYVGGGICDY